MEQYLTLFFSVLALFLNVDHYRSGGQSFWRLVFWLIFWGTSALFYVLVLFTDIGMHPYSPSVRLFHAVLLLSWFFRGYIKHKEKQNA